jgi:hypothetical protein
MRANRSMPSTLIRSAFAGGCGTTGVLAAATPKQLIIQSIEAVNTSNMDPPRVNFFEPECIIPLPPQLMDCSDIGYRQFYVHYRSLQLHLNQYLHFLPQFVVN